MSKCPGLKCPMAVLGMRHLAAVLHQPSNRKLYPVQRLIDSIKCLAILKGLYTHFMGLHLAWLEIVDGISFWCSKCGDGGGLEHTGMLLALYSMW